MLRYLKSFTFFCQILDGMAYLESKKFVHRYLRAANVRSTYLPVNDIDFGI